MCWSREKAESGIGRGQEVRKEKAMNRLVVRVTPRFSKGTDGHLYGDVNRTRSLASIRRSLATEETFMKSTKHSHRKVRCGAPFPGSGNRGGSSSISGSNNMICSMELRGECKALRAWSLHEVGTSWHMYHNVPVAVGS